MTIGSLTSETDVDSGSGTIWVLCALFVLAAVSAGILAVAVAGTQHARAAAAADLAALAAADTLQRRGSVRQACASADRIGGLNGAVLERCVVTGEVVDVAVTGGLVPLIGLPARATARAGPTTFVAGW